MSGQTISDRHVPTSEPGHGAAIFVLLAVELMLMLFCAAMVLLHERELAVMAGTAAVGLAGKIVHRYLVRPSGRRGQLPGNRLAVRDSHHMADRS
jgi:hypothetical protein